jgi:hypothetical protein
MTIQYRTCDASSYQSQRYSMILSLEQSGRVALTAYTDNRGYPTIGAGFKIDSNWDDILTTLGFDTSDDAPAYEEAYVQQRGRVYL